MGHNSWAWDPEPGLCIKRNSEEPVYRNDESPLTTARESHRAARDAAQHAPPLHGTLRKLG